MEFNVCSSDLGLLDEEVPIRDVRNIVETLAEHAPRLAALNPTGSGPDAAELLALVRVALGRAITQQWFPGDAELRVIGLDARLERVLTQALTTSGALEPGLAENVLTEAARAIPAQEANGDATVSSEKRRVGEEGGRTSKTRGS